MQAEFVLISIVLCCNAWVGETLIQYADGRTTTGCSRKKLCQRQNTEVLQQELYETLSSMFQYWSKNLSITASMTDKFPDWCTSSLNAYWNLDKRYQNTLIRRAVANKLFADATTCNNNGNNNNNNTMIDPVCEQRADVFRLFVTVGFCGLFYNASLGEISWLRNYMYFVSLFDTEAVVMFKMRYDIVFTAPNRVPGDCILPPLFLLAVVCLKVIRDLALEHDSSAFILQFYVVLLDVILSMLDMMCAFPHSFLLLPKSACENTQKDMLRNEDYAWMIELWFRLEMATANFKDLLLTCLIADRVLSLFAPIYYMKNCNTTFASRVVLKVFAVNAVLFLFEFCNHRYLDLVMDANVGYYSVYLPTRVCIIFVDLLSLLAQLVLPAVMIWKLAKIARKKKLQHQTPLNLRPYVFLALFSGYSFLTQSAFYIYLAFDTVSLAIATGHCNTCFYFYDQYMFPLASWCVSVFGYLQPVSFITSFVLHIIFVDSYKQHVARLLRIRRVTSPLRKLLEAMETTLKPLMPSCCCNQAQGTFSTASSTRFSYEGAYVIHVKEWRQISNSRITKSAEVQAIEPSGIVSNKNSDNSSKQQQPPAHVNQEPQGLPAVE